jgi:hypothetical protein
VSSVLLQFDSDHATEPGWLKKRVLAVAPRSPTITAPHFYPMEAPQLYEYTGAPGGEQFGFIVAPHHSGTFRPITGSTMTVLGAGTGCGTQTSAGRQIRTQQAVRYSTVNNFIVITCGLPESNSTPGGPLRHVADPHDLFANYKQYEKSDWDGYGAEPISPDTVSAARKLLRFIPSEIELPEIAPGSDGGIGFEWIWTKGPISKLFIDIGPGATWCAYWRTASDKKGSSPRRKIDHTTAVDVLKLFGELGLANVVQRWR